MNGGGIRRNGGSADAGKTKALKPKPAKKIAKQATKKKAKKK